MPTTWNGKSWQIGGNQQDGFIPLLAALARDNSGSPIGPVMPPDEPFPIAQGYALYGSDSGHCCAQRPGRRGPGGIAITPANHGRFVNVPHNFGTPSPNWEANDEASVNFGYAQIKKTHAAAMAIIVKMYGARPRINYFSGESQGGREALMAATRFPEDYDGVTASVPSIYQVPNQFRAALRLRAQVAPGGWIPPAKVPTIANEVRRQCDALDGIEDGVVSNYIGCNRLFDPTTHPDAFAKIRCANGADTGNDCLSDPQIATANAFHADFKFPFALSTGETILTGAPTGGEDDKVRLSPWIGAAKQPGCRLCSSRKSEFSHSAQRSRLRHHGAGFLGNSYGAQGCHRAPLEPSRRSTGPHEILRQGRQADHALLGIRSGGKPAGANAVFRNHRPTDRPQGSRENMRYYVSPNADHSTAGYTYGNREELPRQSYLLVYIQDWVEKGMAPPDRWLRASRISIHHIRLNGRGRSASIRSIPDTAARAIRKWRQATPAAP